MGEKRSPKTNKKTSLIYQMMSTTVLRTVSIMLGSCSVICSALQAEVSFKYEF